MHHSVSSNDMQTRNNVVNNAHAHHHMVNHVDSNASALSASSKAIAERAHMDHALHQVENMVLNASVMPDMVGMASIHRSGAQHHASMHHPATNGTMPMHMMMYFHTESDDILFLKEWRIHSILSIICAFFGLLVLAMLYEGLKVIRENLLVREIQHRNLISAKSRFQPSTPGENGDLATSMIDHNLIGAHNFVEHTSSSSRSRFFSCAHILQTFLHMIQVFISYLLMLAFMTYNVWLCIAVILGAGLGHLVFAWRRIVISPNSLSPDHCH